MNNRLEVLDWDSRHFGEKIARLHGSTLARDEAQAAVEWARRHDVACIYFLAPAETPDNVHDQTRAVALEHGFELVDTRLTLQAHIGRSAPTNFSGLVRDATDGDVDDLAPMARQAFTSSRFFHDSHFDHDKAAELYAIWVEKSVDGRIPSRVFVAEFQDEPVGFVTCNVFERDDGVTVGRIGLLAVAPHARGAGVGSALMGAVGEHYRYRGVTRAEVYTQARNEPAQSLYRRHGYSVQRRENWLHWWADR